MTLLQWLTPWETSVSIVIVTAITALLFIRGSQRCQPQLRQKVYFWIGLLLLYVVSHTQIDYYAEHAFFVHQLQSLVLHHLGPFFIVLACPNQILSAGLPLPVARLLRKISDKKVVQYLWRIICHPVMVAFVFVGSIIFWLLPNIHFITMLDWRLYRLMNWSMLITGLMFWGLVLDAHSQWSAGSRISIMLVVVPPQILIGALIFFVPHELYPIYSLCGRAFAGISSMTDQQIGGLILWMHAAMMSVVGVLIVIYKELRRP